MIAIDVNPASFPTGTYSWKSWGAVSFVLQRKAGPKDHPPSFSSFPSENCSFMYFCAETRSFWYVSLHCWEKMIFQYWLWGDSHSKSVTWWREGNNVWGLVHSWEEQGSPSLSVGGGRCSEEPWMTARRCGGDNSEGTSLLLQTATAQGDRAVRWRCSVGRTGDGGNQIFPGVGVEGTLPTGLLCL